MERDAACVLLIRGSGVIMVLAGYQEITSLGSAAMSAKALKPLLLHHSLGFSC